MDRRTARRKLESLSRRELRRIIGEMLRWTGVDAVVHLIPDAPFPKPGDKAQLVLTAVDVDTTRAQLERVVAFGVALARLDPSQVPALAGAIPDDVGETLAAEVEALARQLEKALEFDAAAGIELVDELTASLVDLDHALRSYGGTVESRWGLSIPRLVDAVASLFEHLVRTAGSTALDDAGFERVAQTTASMSALLGDDEPWTKLEAAIDDEQLADRIGQLQRYLDQRTGYDDTTLHLLRLLARACGRPERVETFVQTAELHLDDDPAVIALIATTYRKLERIDEARFWVGEGRIRHPDADVWDALEGELF